jgi:hypothetical protein
MKINRTALAAAASVVAVVVAGTAALAANFGILAGDSGDEVTTPSVLSTLSGEVFVDVPVEEVTDTPEVAETLAYQVEGVGVVTLERSGDTLGLVSVDLDAQWQFAELPSSNGVVIRFTSADQVIAFSAMVIDGEAVIEVVDETPIPSTGTYDDDESHGGSRGDDDVSYEDD